MICYRDKTFCASDCENFDCRDMLSYSVVMGAEEAKLDICQGDLSANCKRYQPPIDPQQEQE